MPEHEVWITALCNDHLAGLGNAASSLVGMNTLDRPWSNAVTLQITVFLASAILFAILRPRLSVEKPGSLQHFFEVIYQFLQDQAGEIIGPGWERHLHAVSTIFLFVLFASLLGVIPTLESPTMFPEVPLGFALGVFLYYHVVGVQALGPWKYLKNFTGPMPALAPLMIPIELVSHLGRILSLTVRLFANIFASESVFLIFVGMVPLAVPAIFLGEHIFKAVLQAYIFALLMMIYIQGAVVEEH